MEANTMRTPLIKSAIVLLFLVLLAYVTSSSPEGSVLNAVGAIIMGAFHLVQWAFAMAIGLSVCIAFLIGIFLFAVSLVDKEKSAEMYAKVKHAVIDACEPIFACKTSSLCKDSQDSQCAQPPVQAVFDSEKLKGELQTIIAGEVKKVTEHQQTLNEQFASLNAKIQTMEEQSAGFAAAGQVEALAGELENSGKTLGSVQGAVASLEGKLNETVQQLQTITPEKILGDIPARLQNIEQKEEPPVFDPQPLADSLQALQKDVEELKKRGAGNSKSKKKA